MAFSAFWPPPVWGGTWRPQSHRSLPCICLHCLNCSQRCVSFKVETDKGRWIEHSRLSDDYALQTNIISHRMDNFLLARLVCGKKHKNRMIFPFILALFDTLVFFLNEYFIELNTANFNILNKVLNWILSEKQKIESTF